MLPYRLGLHEQVVEALAHMGYDSVRMKVDLARMAVVLVRMKDGFARTKHDLEQHLRREFWIARVTDAMVCSFVQDHSVGIVAEEEWTWEE